MKTLSATAVAVSLAATCVQSEPTTIYDEALFPEGALVHDGQVVFVELGADRLAKIQSGEAVAIWEDGGCFPSSVIDYADGYLMACNGSSLLIQLDADGAELWRKGEDDDGVKFNQPNDLTHDGNGGLWFTASGAPDPAQQPQGQVFHMSGDGAVKLVADGLSYANGLAVSPDGGSLLVADMFAGRVLSYPIDGKRLGDPEPWADLATIAPNPEGGLPPFPDGMEIGPDGNLYIAIWGGQKITVLSLDGAVVSEIETPFLGTTNLDFIDDKTLLVTGVHDISGPPFAGGVIELGLE